MKQLLLAIFAVVVVPSIFFGCTKYVVRDTVAYQVELDQYNAWATKQAALLKEFVADPAPAACVCDADFKFTTERCAKSADYLLTVEARHEWHKAMSLYLAGISEERPSEAPPEIPANSSLCPGAPETMPDPPPTPEPAPAPAPEPVVEGGE